MRTTHILMQAAKQGPKKKKIQVPVEMYPLFAAVGVAIASLSYFSYRHFAYDQQLRLWKNPDLSALDEVLNKATEEEKANEKGD